MKRFFLVAVCLLGLQISCFAQNNGYNRTKIEEVKRAFITQQLRLTPAEAQVFFPLYNQYMADLNLAWQQSNGNRNWFIEKSAEIRDNYRNSFVQILHSHERADNVFRAERSFRMMLQNEMRQRGQYRGNFRGGGGRRR
jgi:hypothetical protein